MVRSRRAMFRIQETIMFVTHFPCISQICVFEVMWERTVHSEPHPETAL